MQHLTRNVVEAGDYGFMVGNIEGATTDMSASKDGIGQVDRRAVSPRCRCAIWRSRSARTMDRLPSSPTCRSRSRRARRVCIVGESGCGKSMTALSLLRLLPDVAEIARGEILIDGDDLLAMDQTAVEDAGATRIAMIFQEPLSALNPVMTIGEQIAEAVRQHRRGQRGQGEQRALEMLALVQMPDPDRRAANIRISSPAACASGR